MAGNLSHFQCLACWVVEFNYKCPFNTGWQQYKWPFQVLFRCPRPLNRGVRLIKVSFLVNEGNKFGDFGYCPLNRRCPLNTGFTVPADTMHGTLLTVRLETFWNLTNFRGTITSSFISSGVNLYRMKHSVPFLYKSYWMAKLIIKIIVW